MARDQIPSKCDFENPVSTADLGGNFECSSNSCSAVHQTAVLFTEEPESCHRAIHLFLYPCKTSDYVLVNRHINMICLFFDLLKAKLCSSQEMSNAFVSLKIFSSKQIRHSLIPNQILLFSNWFSCWPGGVLEITNAGMLLILTESSSKLS